jgi:ribosomal protein L11 methyltransferase
MVLVFELKSKIEEEEELKMKTKPLWKISAVTTPEAEDAVAEMLGSLLECPASTYFNLKTGVSTVSVICERKPENGVNEKISARLARIRSCGLATGAGKISVARIKREDWAESWKRHFTPIEIGEKLLIKPSWSKRRPRKNESVVVLDPGLSFGTGQHPTTEFCLCEIVRRADGSSACSGKTKDLRTSRPRSSFLDIGTGSGILAIAAAKLGYQPVHAFDFDADAVRIARANARVNNVRRKMKIGHGDVGKLPLRPSQKYDLICANLICDLLIAERRRITAHLNHGGTLVLAGILRKEFPQVQRSFENLGLTLVRSRNRNEWCSGAFRRTSNF